MTTLVIGAAALLLLVSVAIFVMTIPSRPRGRVILLGLDFGRRARYTLRIETESGTETLDISPGEIPRLAAALAGADDRDDFPVPRTGLVIPAWAVPEARRVIASVAVAMGDPYEYARRQEAP